MDILAKINEFLGEAFPNFDFLKMKPKYDFNFRDTLFCVVSELDRHSMKYDGFPILEDNINKYFLSTDLYSIQYLFIEGKLFNIMFRIHKSKNMSLFGIFIRSYFKKFTFKESNLMERYYYCLEGEKQITVNLWLSENVEYGEFHICDTFLIKDIDDTPTIAKIEPTKPQHQKEEEKEEKKVQWVKEDSEAERLKDIIRKRTE